MAEVGGGASLVWCGSVWWGVDWRCCVCLVVARPAPACALVPTCSACRRRVSLLALPRRRAQRADVPVEYVLRVGGFELEKVEDQVGPRFPPGRAFLLPGQACCPSGPGLPPWPAGALLPCGWPAATLWPCCSTGLLLISGAACKPGLLLTAVPPCLARCLLPSHHPPTRPPASFRRR